MRIHCLQHVSFETPGSILEWAAMKGHSVSFTRFFEPGFALPSMNDFDHLLIMGGYMNADEEQQYPWLAAEKTFIRAAIDAGKKVLGICLGSQLVARVLGARVYKGKEKEIGFYPIRFSASAQQHPLFSHYPFEYLVFHWHGDTFDLPEGAVRIASSEACLNQAFVLNDQVLALQFHPEMNPATINAMLLHDGGELEEKGHFIQSRETIENSYGALEANQADLFMLLDKFWASE